MSNMNQRNQRPEELPRINLNHGTRRELIEALSVLSEKENLRVTVKQSLKAGAIVGGTTMIGALMAGPFGILLGSVVGTFISYSSSKDFKSVAEILINDLSDEEKNRLCDAVIDVTRSVDLRDVAGLVMLIQTNASIQAMVATAIVRFVTSEMNMTIID